MGTNPLTSAEERGHSPEHIAALEHYDSTVRLVKRHQRTWHCGTAQKVHPGKGISPGAWSHAYDPNVKAEHDQVIADREAAYEAVQVADPKVPKPLEKKAQK